ncbi:MAG TPA: class I SAM-dependent methyltransferase [Verrucomicrobiales bacterium]|nr:class I SAM-dependent methyltransferase [Verrucomicrobiales bacterium]
MKIDYTRYYLKWHQDTPEHVQHMIAYYRRLLDNYFTGSRDVKILDVGCGMGFAIMMLKEIGYTNVYGVESDQGQVDSCCSKGLKVDYTEDTIQYLKNRQGAFDMILSIDVIEHIPVDVQLGFVDAISAALRSNGRFICSVPNANSAIASRWRYNDWTHHSSFTEHSLDFLLYNGGFDEIEVVPSEMIEKPANAWLPLGAGKHWWLFRFFRIWRRLQMMAELGPQQGRGVPLSLNLLASSTKK